jgi:hypothetical protein
MAGLPTVQTIVRPNTQSPTNLTHCQQYCWVQWSSPNTPWLWKAGQTRGRAVKMGANTVDFNGIQGVDELWYLLEVKWMKTPEAVNPYLVLGEGQGHYLNFHSLPVSGDVGWQTYLVSPVLFSYNAIGHVMQLPHDAPGLSGSEPDNGSGAGDINPTKWQLPTPPIDVWTSIIIHIVFGRAIDYADANCPPGRVRVWVNTADASIVSPANGAPQLDTLTRTPGVNTRIRDLTVGNPTSGKLQQWTGPLQGTYIPTGFANIATDLCKTCANSGGCVNGLLDRHHYQSATAARVGKTLASAVADTNIIPYAPNPFDHSIYNPGTSPNYGDTSYTTLTGASQRSTDTFIMPPALNPNPNAPTITSFTPTSGTAGVTSVVITGTHFVVGGSTVTFNGVVAGVVVDSTTQITTTCPVGATTGKIQVVTTNGTAISTLDFTVGGGGGPVLPDPAANHLRAGSSFFDFMAAGGTNLKAVHKAQLGPVSVSIDQAYCFIAGPASGGNQSIRVVVYDDDGAAGAPGSFLGMSNLVSVVQGVAGAWVSFPFSTPAQGTGDIYYGVWRGTPASTQGYQTVTNANLSNTNTFDTLNPPSNPFGTANVSGSKAALVIDYTVTGDTRAPVLAEASVDGATLTLEYDEALDPANIPAVDRFTVTVNQLVYAVSAVAISGSDVLLSIDPAVITGDIVTVGGYAQTGTDDLQDAFGNKCAALPTTAVLNNTLPASTGDRRIDPASRTSGLSPGPLTYPGPNTYPGALIPLRRVDPSDRRTGEGGGL